MGAGEDDDVHPVATGLIAQTRNRAGDDLAINRLAAQLGLGAGDESGAAVAQHDFFSGELRAQIVDIGLADGRRSEEHTSELQSLMRNSYAVFCLKKKNKRAPQNQRDASNEKILKLDKHCL